VQQHPRSNDRESNHFAPQSCVACGAEKDADAKVLLSAMLERNTGGGINPAGAKSGTAIQMFDTDHDGTLDLQEVKSAA
jgi:hypothetical protein